MVGEWVGAGRGRHAPTWMAGHVRPELFGGGILVLHEHLGQAERPVTPTAADDRVQADQGRDDCRAR